MAASNPSLTDSPIVQPVSLLATEVLTLAAAAISALLALVAIARDRRAFVHRAFAGGMVALSAQELLRAWSARATSPADVLRWELGGQLAAALSPGIWLLFALSYGRSNRRVVLRAWRWRVAAVIGVPLSLCLLPSTWFYDEAALGANGWVFRLNWSGLAFQISLVFGYVLVLLNLERTFRAAAGSMRWRVKFVALGLGAFFGIRIYTISQTLLFRSVDPRLRTLEAGALIVCEALLLLALIRTRLGDVDVYLSPSTLYQSFTLIVIGVYLLVVGTLPVILRLAGEQAHVFLGSFAVFVALLLLTIFLLSDRLRHRARRSVNRAFGRPQYDYRRVWSVFTERTSAVPDSRALSAAVAGIVSETLAVPAVSVWLLDDTRDGLVLGASTQLSDARSRFLASGGSDIERILQGMRTVTRTVDLVRNGGRTAGELDRLSRAFREEARVRYLVGLRSGGELLGIMTLGERLGDASLAIEDLDLVETIADQAAARLLSLDLAGRLLRAREMEAFQSLSAFFIHDLKNLASRLSVAMQNLPRHYQDPAFRNDLLGVISRSVEKVNSLCSRLSTLTRTLELAPANTDLNEFVRDTLAGLEGTLRTRVRCQLEPMPMVLADSEQLQKILVNLLLNAEAAVGDEGEVTVKTGSQPGWGVLTVADTGCGMSGEFMATELFKPFRTTKPQGIGIGLYHSKKIAEAHGGRLEAESELGRGSTFRLFLPLAPVLAVPGQR